MLFGWSLLSLAGVFMLAHTLFKIVHRVYKAYQVKQILKNVPGPSMHPFGKDFADNKHRLHEWWNGILQGYPGAKIVNISIADGQAVALTADADVVKHILKDEFDIWTKSDGDLYIVELLKEWIGESVFTLRHGPAHPKEHGQWFNHRKTSTQLFKHSNFRGTMRTTFQSKANIILDQLKSGEVIDMEQKFFAFTMDSTLLLFFNYDSNTLIPGCENKFATAYDTAHRSLFRFMLPNLPLVQVSRLLPWPLGSLTQAWSPLVTSLARSRNDAAKEFAEACKVQREECKNIIRKRMEGADVRQSDDLLARFMTSKNVEGKPMDEEELVGMIANIVIAGRDTTACLLSWLFFMLTENPKVQEKLCKEIDEKLGDSEPTYDALAATEMPYLNGVVYEALRLYPPVPFDMKVATQDTTLPDGTFWPKDGRIFFCPYAMGRDPQRYTNPDTVDPQRWIPFEAPSPFDFPVFQAGPRICLGQAMAIFETKLLVANLLRQYTFTLLDGEREKITPSVTFTMSLCNSKSMESHQLLLVPHKRSV